MSGHLRREKSQHWAAVDAVTAGLTGVSRQQTEVTLAASGAGVQQANKSLHFKRSRNTQEHSWKSRRAPINPRTLGGGRHSHNRSHRRIMTTDKELDSFHQMLVYSTGKHHYCNNAKWSSGEEGTMWHCEAALLWGRFK